MWLKALDELGEKVCEIYPFLCELCDDTCHFNFQCSSQYRDSFNRMRTVNLYYDDKITLNQHDELTLFLGCEEISRKISLLDMRVVDINSTLRGCRLYCVKDCLTNTYIQNLIKHDVLPSYDRTNRCFYLINREEESSKVYSVVSVSKPDYVEKIPFKPLPPQGESKKKKKKKKKRRSKRREETVSSPKHVAPIIDYDNSDFDDVPIPVTYVSDHDWEKHSTFDIENLFGTKSKVNNCCTISTIHVPSYDDMFDEYALQNSCSLAYDDMFSVHLLLRRKLVMITICLLFFMTMVMRIIILLNLLLLRLFMWGVLILLCMWLMIGMLYVIVMLVLFMMLLKVTMREGNMV
jgi:hypothetical protein